MSMTAEPLPEGYVAHFPQSRPPLRHPLGPAVLVRKDKSISGFEQHEKTCSHCGAVRVTIIGGTYARAWRKPGDAVQRPFEPVCRAVEVGQG